MARLPRNEQPGRIYHVVVRGVNRDRIYVDAEDYQRFVRLLATVVRRQEWNLLSYCLMPNHAHLLIETPKPNLGNGMQWLLGLYARTFNDRHHRVGHLFQDRYRSPVIKNEAGLVRAVGYIAMNPVAASLCRRVAEWEWGSHPLVSNGRPCPGWLAHDRLQDLLEGATGARCYAELVATQERALLTQPSQWGQTPLGGLRR